jgi:tRNA-Thr(GGU) m(6)t(6)A37 methyltransferase TsaA
MEPVTYTPIGVIHTPFTDLVGMPLHPVAAAGVRGTVELDPLYAPGLQDLAEFDYVILLYHQHLTRGSSLVVTPFLDDQPHGVFATRSPRHPNPIGLSVVRLIAVEGPTLTIEEIDMIDGTPLLDIKPYVPTFDARATDRIGWYAANAQKVYTTRADARFRDPPAHET